jgi:predicted transcriptional regulator of viral defense system
MIKNALGNNIFITFTTKSFNMTLQKWIKDRAIHGYPTFSIEDVRESGMYSSEQIMKNELNRLCSNKTIVNVYRGFYVIIPVHYVLRGSVPATYYIDQLMTYLSKPYYVCMLSAAELLGVAHQRPQQFSVMTTYPRRQLVTTRNVTTDWFYRDTMPEDALVIKNTETGTIRISNSLLTAADLVQNQQHVGGLSRVATILEELTEQIDIDSQFPALISFVKTVTWQRLGYILENVIEDRVTADKLFEQLRASSARMVYKPLSTSAEDNPSSRDRRWKININVEIETDDI